MPLIIGLYATWLYATNYWFLCDLGPVSRKPRKRFGPVKPKQNLEPYDYRAVLFTFSQYEERFTSYKKFQAYTLLRFYIQMKEKWLYAFEKIPGLSRNGPLVVCH